MPVHIPNANGSKSGASPGQVVRYYDQLADRYDQDRFGISYGVYVDAQERRLLRKWLAPVSQGKTLDLACGTGRLLDLATHGLDASQAMVRIARSKHPGKPIHCASGSGAHIVPAAGGARSVLRPTRLWCLPCGWQSVLPGSAPSSPHRRTASCGRASGFQHEPFGLCQLPGRAARRKHCDDAPAVVGPDSLERSTLHSASTGTHFSQRMVTP